MILHHSWEFTQVHWDYVKRLGLVDNNLLGMPRRPCLAVRQYRVLPRECFVYVVHATALTIFGIFFMHVQVTTRLLLASSPVLPWLAAILTTRRDKPAVALAEGEEAQAEALLKIECKTNLESSTDTILFQVIIISIIKICIAFAIAIFYIHCTCQNPLCFHFDQHQVQS